MVRCDFCYCPSVDKASALQLQELRIEAARLKIEIEKHRARAACWRAHARKFEADKKRTQERMVVAKLQASEDRDISRREEAQRRTIEREDKALREELNQPWFPPSGDPGQGAPHGSSQ